MKIYVNNEPLIVVLKKFRKFCEREGIVKEVKKHMFFEKPSERKRRARIRSIKEMQKRQKEADEERGR